MKKDKGWKRNGKKKKNTGLVYPGGEIKRKEITSRR